MEVAVGLRTRERECLELASQGLTYVQIGHRLGVGSETVKGHMANARKRLGAASNTHLVAIAIRAGLIT